MVLMVFVVGFALVGAFLVAIVGSATVSQTTRSGIQAQAAAEAGLAAQIAAIGAGNPCTVNAVSGDSAGGPIYNVSVEKGDCTLPVDAKITITSAGTAPDGTQATVVATYAVSPGDTVQTVSAGGPGIVTAYSLGIFKERSRETPRYVVLERAQSMGRFWGHSGMLARSHSTITILPSTWARALHSGCPQVQSVLRPSR